MHSRIYRGWIQHRRYRPCLHDFRYQVCMAYLDLEELPEVFNNCPGWSTQRPALAWFHRADHLPPSSLPLAEAVRRLVHARTGRRPGGPIRLLTHLRYFGYCMNPVSFYYCFDPTGRTVEFIVAEINNTPWKEQYCYVLDCRAQARVRGSFKFNKAFHISPFMPMGQQYRWRFSHPSEKLHVAMQNAEDGRVVFQAGMALNAERISATVLTKALLAHPLMSWKIIYMIYWQALLLWLKRVPFYTHPGKAT